MQSTNITGKIESPNKFLLFEELSGIKTEVQSCTIKRGSNEFNYNIIDEMSNNIGNFSTINNKSSIRGYIIINNISFVFASARYKEIIVLRTDNKSPLIKNFGKAIRDDKSLILVNKVKRTNTFTSTNNIRMINDYISHVTNRGYKTGYVFQKYKKHALFYCIDDLFYIKDVCNYSEKWFNQVKSELKLSNKWRT